LDRIRHGTSNRGHRNGQSKLTEEDVKKIANLKGRLPQKELAEKYGVSISAISSIQLGRRWGWCLPKQDENSMSLVSMEKTSL
jgi:hypothetical protein